MARKKDKNISPITEKQIEAKSTELIKEFYAHLEEYERLYPDDKDNKEEVFHGWVIQKIAGLQLSIFHISERINDLIERLKRTE